MSEIEDGTPIEDTPQPDAEGVNPGDTPEEGTAPDQAATENWEARYKEAQAWGTRMAQERAQYEAQAALVNDLNSDDPEARKRAFAQFGIELADEEPTVYDDPQDELAARLERLEQSLQQQNQASQHAQQIAQIEAHVDAQLASLDGLDDGDKEWIVNTAVAMPPTPEGMPDIKGAHEKFVAWEQARQQRWASTKRAPAIKAGGQAGTKALPMDATHQQRVDFMAERLLADQ